MFFGKGAKGSRQQGIEASRHKGKTDVQGGCGWKMGNCLRARMFVYSDIGFVFHICPAEGEFPRLVPLARDDTRVDVEGCRLASFFRKEVSAGSPPQACGDDRVGAPVE